MDLNLKFITSMSDLIGKEIKYCYFVEDNDDGYNIIATTDNCIRIVEQDYDDYGYFRFNSPIENKEQFNELLLRYNGSWYFNNIVKDLISNGVITQEYYDYIIEEDRKKKQAEENMWNNMRQKQEYEKYLELKEKFENKLR